MRCCCIGLRCVMLFTACGLLGLAALGTRVFHAAETPGTDTSMFGGTPQRNMVNLTAKDLPIEANVKQGERKNVKWVAELGSHSYGGPVVAGGKVYVGTNNSKPRNPAIKGDRGILLCLRESDGQLLWQAVHDKLSTAHENDFPEQGIASTPAVEGNRLYYVSNRCELICADTHGFTDGKNDGVQDEQNKNPTDADIIWRYDMMKELNVFPHSLANCSPLVAGDLVFVLTSNGTDDQGQLPAPQAPSFIAVNKLTGKLVWKDNSPGKDVMDGQWANPAYAVVNGQPQVIFPGGDGWLRGFEATTGKPLWKFDCNPKSSAYKARGASAKNYLVATPVVHENKVYIGVGRQPDECNGVGHFWCIDITKTGDLSPVNDNFDPKAAVNKNSGLVWHIGGAIMPRPKTGREFNFGCTIATCAIHDGLLYIAETDGYLRCFDAKAGEHYWEHDLKAGVWGSPYYADGKVYLGTVEGDLYVFAPGKEKKQLGKIELDEPIHGTPVADGKVLFVQTDAHLFALAQP